MPAPTQWPLVPLTLTLAVWLVACDKAPVVQVTDPAPGEQRLMLNQGYSMLYYDATQIGSAKLILPVKVESDAVNSIITDISDFGARVAKDLEQLARDYPAVRIDLDPLPEMEKRKRADVKHERALSFAPIVGRTGGDFERSLLLSMSAVVSQESHLCKVMADEEPDPALKKFLLDSKRGLDQLYDRAVRILNRDYFKGGVSQPERH